MINKKGLGDVALWIIRIIMLVGIIAVIGFLKNIALSNALQTHDTEFYIAHTKTLYSPTGLAYQSLNTGRTYPGIINLEDINETVLNESITRRIPTRITLIAMNKTMIKQVYYDEERYKLLEPLTFAQQYDLLNKTHLILLKEGEQIKPAILRIEMVISR